MKISKSKLFKIIAESMLEEGVYDPGILKAVFMAGGPGSGKSRIAADLFYLPREELSSFSPLGLKILNSDPAFEMFLKKMGVDPKKLSELSPEEFADLTLPTDSPRQKARALRDKAAEHYMSSRLGLIIDGTGENYEKVEKKKAILNSLGYDTYMVFVNTDLDVALERNSKRSRVLPEELVERAWRRVRRNMGKFQDLFEPDKFRIIDNTYYDPIPEKIHKAVMRFVNEPVMNPIGKEWIRDQMSHRNMEKNSEN